MKPLLILDCIFEVCWAANFIPGVGITRFQKDVCWNMKGSREQAALVYFENKNYKLQEALTKQIKYNQLHYWGSFLGWKQQS